MTEDDERRLARNESLFRKVNEAIERGLWPGEEREPVRFRCECASFECGEVVEISVAAYEAVRQHPRRFVIVDGHEVPEIELVVSREAGWAVVEKLDAAGDEAAERDQR